MIDEAYKVILAPYESIDYYSEIYSIGYDAGKAAAANDTAPANKTESYAEAYAYGFYEGCLEVFKNNENGYTEYQAYEYSRGFTNGYIETLFEDFYAPDTSLDEFDYEQGFYDGLDKGKEIAAKAETTTEVVSESAETDDEEPGGGNTINGFPASGSAHEETAITEEAPVSSPQEYLPAAAAMEESTTETSSEEAITQAAEEETTASTQKDDTEELTETTAETTAAVAADDSIASDGVFGTGIELSTCLFIGASVLLVISVIICIATAASAKKRRRRNMSLPQQGAEPIPPTAPSPGAVTTYPMKVGKLHEQGAREEQQDSFAVSDSELVGEYGILAVVADGMGGLADGAKVSAAAVKAALDTFLMSHGTVAPKELLITLLKQAVASVNETLGEENMRKSGTTMAMGYIRSGYFSFVSVGDSRISLYRNGILMQLNREHNYEDQLLVRAVNDEITVQEALNDSKGKGLVSFIGIGRLGAVDIPNAPIKLYPGDKIIIMSDGVYNALPEEELTAALRPDAPTAADNIRAAVKAKNYTNQDNFTAVILEYGG